MMTGLRALFFASLLGGLALAACGSAGSGGTGGPYASPALGTNNPAPPSTPTEKPYSEGY